MSRREHAARRRTGAAGCAYERTGRAILVAGVASSAVVFSRLLYDVFNTPKLLVVVTCGLALTGLGVVARCREHRLVLPRSGVTTAAAAFAVVAAVAALGSASPARAATGASNARGGLALYLACLVVFLAATVLYRASSPVPVVNALLVAAVPVLAYAAVQALGFDPFAWRSAGDAVVFSTFGNSNFFSAWAGVVSVLGAWSATRSGAPVRLRVAGGLLGVAAVAVGLVSESIQGPVAAFCGLAFMALAGLTDGGRHVRAGRWRAVVTTAVPLLLLLAGAVVAYAGAATASFGTRIGLWRAALSMGVDRPLTGVGLDLFADWYHAYRPVSDAVSRGLGRTADAAHSVPLQLLSGGGVPLLAAYLAFVAGVGLVLVRGIRRSHGEQRLLLGGLGGAWVAYQLQSLVSIDVPPLALLHWLLAGLIVAVAAPDIAGRVTACRHRAWSRSAAAATTAVAGVVVLALATPLRAEVAARRGVTFTARGDHARAEESFQTALRLNTWEPAYALGLARERAHRGDAAAAYQAYVLASARQPRGIAQALERARIADDARRHSEAAAAYADAVTIDPNSPPLLVEAARHHIRWGDPELALTLLARAVSLDGPTPLRTRLASEAQQADERRTEPG